MNSLTEKTIYKNDIYFQPKKLFVPEKGIGETILEQMKLHSNSIMQTDAITGKEETYASVLSKSIRVSQNLRKNSIKVGDIISLLSYNNMDYSTVVLASFFTGAINAPIDPTAPFLDIVHCLKITKPKIIFCEKELEILTEKAIKTIGCNIEIVVFGESENNIPYTDYLVSDPDETEEDFQVYKVKDFKSTVCIHFSSGTTGFQKAVCITQYGLIFSIFLHKSNHNMPLRSMIVTNPFWISNMLSLLGSILNGYNRIIVKIFDEKTFMKTIQEFKINIVTITPVNGAILLEYPEYYKGYDVSSLRILATGGSSTSPKQFIKYMEVFPNALIITGYGMTETSGIMLKVKQQNLNELSKQEKVCVGDPIPGFIYRIVDPETNEILGPNQEGELRVKCKVLLNNYYNNQKAYEESFDSDGFFKTGDILYYDDQCNFYYVTRMKDIFKYKGWHISPVIIENILLKHTNIKEVVVFGVPTQTDGELVTAGVILKDESIYDEQELINFVKERLPDRYHILGGIFILNKIPTTSSGKIQRRKLTEMVLKMHNKL